MPSDPAFAIQLSLASFRLLPGLRCQPLGANSLESCSRAFKATRHPHLGPIPWPQASRFRPTFQVLFCRGPSAFLPAPCCRRSSAHFSGNEGARHTVKIGYAAATAQALRRQIMRRPLPPGRRPSSTTSDAVRRQQRRRRRGDRPIKIESVGAAVERAARVEQAHFRRQARRCRPRRYKADWRRSRRTGRATPPPYRRRRRPRVSSPSGGHCRARRASAPRLDVGADAEGVRQFASSSASRIAPRAGAEIGDAQGARARAARHRPRRARPRRPFPSPAAAPASRHRRQAAGSKIPCCRRCARPARGRAGARASAAIASALRRRRACARRPPPAPA